MKRRVLLATLLAAGSVFANEKTGPRAHSNAVSVRRVSGTVRSVDLLGGLVAVTVGADEQVISVDSGTVILKRVGLRELDSLDVVSIVSSGAAGSVDTLVIRAAAEPPRANVNE